MPKRIAVILGMALLLAACATPQLTGVATNSPPATTPLSAQTALPTGSGQAARFAAFRTHVSVSAVQLGRFLSDLKLDEASKNTAAIKNDATSIRAWSKSESAWLGQNPIAGCYATLYTLWDNARVHADEAAVAALADRYDQVPVDLAIAASKKVTAGLGQIVC